VVSIQLRPYVDMHNGSFCRDALAIVDIFSFEWCVRISVFPTVKKVRGGNDLISFNHLGVWFETLGNSTNSPWFRIHFPDYIEYDNLPYAGLECWVFIHEILHSCVWVICRYLLSKPAEASVHENLSCDEVAWWLEPSHSMLTDRTRSSSSL
jgi:hypothetical protein